MVDVVTEVLLLHNIVRQGVGLPNLVLDSVLTALAQSWAEEGVKEGVFKHTGEHKFGENIAWKIYPADYPIVPFGSDVQKLFNQWYKEKQFFQPGTFPNVTKDQSRDVSHYTQVVWKNSKKVGIGYGKNKQYSYLVCFYDPPGNIIGQVIN